MIEFLPHTADIKIRVTADTLENLFREGVEALYQYLKPIGADSTRTDADSRGIFKEVELEARDLTTLFIDFLSEVLSLTQIEKMRFQVESIMVQGFKLQAILEGTIFEGLEDDIKAITYHQAEIKTVNGGYEAVFIVDV